MPRIVNGIHEVSGSIPLGSTIGIQERARNFLARRVTIAS